MKQNVENNKMALLSDRIVAAVTGEALAASTEMQQWDAEDLAEAVGTASTPEGLRQRASRWVVRGFYPGTITVNGKIAVNGKKETQEYKAEPVVNIGFARLAEGRSREVEITREGAISSLMDALGVDRDAAISHLYEHIQKTA